MVMIKSPCLPWVKSLKHAGLGKFQANSMDSSQIPYKFYLLLCCIARISPELGGGTAGVESSRLLLFEEHDLLSLHFVFQQMY